MQLTERNYPPVSETFPHILTFAPQRWEKWQPKAWTYIPFNGGPRLCVGQQFALTEMGYTVVRMLQKFKRVESRQLPPSYAGHSKSEKVPKFGLEDVEKSTARQMADSRELKYKSEIVLQPAEKVR